MLTKISHIFLALLFMVTTMGMTVSKHFCGSYLQSTSVLSEIEPCCDMPDCCHNESITLEIKDDFSVTSYNFDFTQLAVDLPALVELVEIEVSENNSYLISENTPPPPKIQTVLSRFQSYLL
jgi:hypothetical protein